MPAHLLGVFGLDVPPRAGRDSWRERGRVRSCSSSPLDLTSGGPARGLHAPPGPNGLLRGRHVPPALLPPHRPLTTPRVVSSLSPQLIRSCSRYTSTNASFLSANFIYTQSSPPRGPVVGRGPLSRGIRAVTETGHDDDVTERPSPQHASAFGGPSSSCRARAARRASRAVVIRSE